MESYNIWNLKLKVSLKTVLYILCGWFLLASINYLLKKVGFSFNTPLYFPVSILTLKFYMSSIPYAVLFLLFLFYVVTFDLIKFNIKKALLLGIGFIICGNLMQGGFQEAFINPFIQSGIQYYSDAVKINNWKEWLENFNAVQPSLIAHSRTHPAFAVLLHYFLLLGESPLFISIVFSVISSMSIVLIYSIFIALKKSQSFASSCVLLYSLIPAFNIYSIVSLDGVIAAFMTAALLGIIRIEMYGLSFKNIFLLVAGIVVSSMLTFGSLFLWVVFGVIVFLEIYKKKYKLFTAFLIVIGFFLFLIFMVNYIFHYDYIASFLTASKLENQSGILLFNNPVEYIMTRIENGAEVLLFLSIGVLSVFFSRTFRVQSVNKISFIAFSTLLLMWIAGAYRTGETARACLFIYPYFFLIMPDLSSSVLRSLFVQTGLQTLIMQLFGNYFW